VEVVHVGGEGVMLVRWCSGGGACWCGVEVAHVGVVRWCMLA
jgi:hypothetical protein